MSSSILQLIKGKSKDLQKLLKFFNEPTTSAFNIIKLIDISLIIFVLYSEELLVIVFAVYPIIISIIFIISIIYVLSIIIPQTF